MTEDRDFKKVVRERSAKTGESYQAARRQLDRQPARLSARVHMLWAHPDGLVLGCRVEAGEIARGMAVTVLAGDTAARVVGPEHVVLHEGTIASLRVGKEDRDVVTSGDCGIMLDPPFHGYVATSVDEPHLATGALRPVEVVPLPYLVVG